MSEYSQVCKKTIYNVEGNYGVLVKKYPRVSFPLEIVDSLIYIVIKRVLFRNMHILFGAKWSDSFIKLYNLKIKHLRRKFIEIKFVRIQSSMQKDHLQCWRELWCTCKKIPTVFSALGQYRPTLEYYRRHFLSYLCISTLHVFFFKL